MIESTFFKHIFISYHLFLILLGDVHVKKSERPQLLEEIKSKNKSS